jgi:uncharacterized protein (TIGR01777 family)
MAGGLDQVVVAGGTGLVGRHLAAALASLGIRVTVLSRAPGPGTCGWDALPEALEGADAVINLCGAGIADRRWTAARKQALLDSRVGPTGRLVQAMAAGAPKVLVNASAVGLYGALDERPADEAQAPGQGFLAQLCQRWEAAADAALAHGVRVVKLRLGVVLARDGGALAKMALPVRLGLGTRLGHGRQGLSWIHVDDLVRLIIETAANPAYAGPVNAVAPMAVSSATFTRALARRLKRPLLPVPAWVTRAALTALLGEMGEAMLLEGAFVLPRQAERLGFTFLFPRLEEALADLI